MAKKQRGSGKRKKGSKGTEKKREGTNERTIENEVVLGVSPSPTDQEHAQVNAKQN